MKQNEKKKHRYLGWGAGWLLKLFGKNPRLHSPAELYRKDFHPNTQKMGLRFSERIRNIFRHRWLKHHRF